MPEESQKMELTLEKLLTGAFVISQKDANRAKTLSQISGLPFGKALVLMDYLTESELSAALEVQALVKDALLPPDTAIAAMQIVRRKGWHLADALVSMDCEISMASIRSRIGRTRSMGFSTSTGRAHATSTSPHTSRFSGSCQRPPAAPPRLGSCPTARLMAAKNGTRKALRDSR